MQRSIFPSPPTSRTRRSGAVLIVSALMLTLGAGGVQAHDRGRSDGQGQHKEQKRNEQKRTDPKQVAQPAPAAQTAERPSTTAAYVYLKRDVAAPVSWENSTQQYLVATWPGASYRKLTLAEITKALPPGVVLCGPGWAVQEDQAYGDASLFTDSPAPSYPKSYIGWPPIHHAQHFELSDMVTVPACEPTPTATPTATPSATPPPATTPTPTTTPSPSLPPAPAPSVTPTPTQSVPVVLPAPSQPPTAPPAGEVDDVTPTTPAPTEEVLAAGPTPTATFYSEVLADDGDGAVLAATGSSATPGVLAAAILMLSGAALLLVRRRRTGSSTTS
ncbi:LPXTG cell wall anchor domain-containing protein [Cellulomonas fengjieae]|uniref:LPXTG cell wall anchor domain-containing protein n=1 Tax=Cellulomonas fengjieae TaxID=2819978 RepID=UPI001AAEA50D|nr:LPXTG cell wall anchor domain-containing protein [Cellulomonas fengjieae]MBO3101675.1 LPXTG cell wall anchor domain-containing protein [Cellulomonas fengjieae]